MIQGWIIFQKPYLEHGISLTCAIVLKLGGVPERVWTQLRQQQIIWRHQWWPPYGLLPSLLSGAPGPTSATAIATITSLRLAFHRLLLANNHLVPQSIKSKDLVLCQLEHCWWSPYISSFDSCIDSYEDISRRRGWWMLISSPLSHCHILEVADDQISSELESSWTGRRS